jgi:hypothetical protein
MPRRFAMAQSSHWPVSTEAADPQLHFRRSMGTERSATDGARSHTTAWLRAAWLIMPGLSRLFVPRGLPGERCTSCTIAGAVARCVRSVASRLGIFARGATLLASGGFDSGGMRTTWSATRSAFAHRHPAARRSAASVALRNSSCCIPGIRRRLPCRVRISAVATSAHACSAEARPHCRETCGSVGLRFVGSAWLRLVQTDHCDCAETVPRPGCRSEHATLATCRAPTPALQPVASPGRHQADATELAWRLVAGACCSFRSCLP